MEAVHADALVAVCRWDGLLYITIYNNTSVMPLVMVFIRMMVHLPGDIKIKLTVRLEVALRMN